MTDEFRERWNGESLYVKGGDSRACIDRLRYRQQRNATQKTDTRCLQVSGDEYQQLLTQAFQPPSGYIPQTPAEQVAHSQAFQQHGIPAMLPSQISAPEPSYGIEQPMMPSQMQRHMSHVVSLHDSPWHNDYLQTSNECHLAYLFVLTEVFNVTIVQNSSC